MRKGGWDSSYPLDQQRKWLEKEKKDRTKKIGVLLVHQLTGLIEQVSVSGKKWADDKEKIKMLESRNSELEKRNQLLEDQSWGTLPPYPSSTAVKPTAPVGDFDPNEEEVHDLAPIIRGGTLQHPTARYKPFTSGERQQVLASLGKLQPRSGNSKFWAELDTI